MKKNIFNITGLIITVALMVCGIVGIIASAEDNTLKIENANVAYNDMMHLTFTLTGTDALPDGAVAGRASQAVEYMAILPKRGKKQALIDGAARVGVLLQTARKQFADGKTHECLIFPTAYQQKFKQQIRDVVKAREK